MEITTKGQDMQREFINHGTTLVHGMDGTSRNLLSEISVTRGTYPPETGYTYCHGWVDHDGTKWDLFTKPLPLPK